MSFKTHLYCEICSQEDIGLAGNAVPLMCRTLTFREGDHYQAACMLRSELGACAPTIPDFAIDKHSHEGRKLVAASCAARRTATTADG